MTDHTIALIAGDGIGPEVTAAVQKVLSAAGAPLAWEEHVAALDRGLDVLPEQTVAAIRQHGVALKGPCTTPVGKGFSSVMRLRKQLDLYAAVARAFPARRANALRERRPRHHP